MPLDAAESGLFLSGVAGGDAACTLIAGGAESRLSRSYEFKAASLISSASVLAPGVVAKVVAEAEPDHAHGASQDDEGAADMTDDDDETSGLVTGTGRGVVGSTICGNAPSALISGVDTLSDCEASFGEVAGLVQPT